MDNNRASSSFEVSVTPQHCQGQSSRKTWEKPSLKKLDIYEAQIGAAINPDGGVNS